MKIENVKYVICTNRFPLIFEDNDGENTIFIEEALLHEGYEEAKDELDRFDEPSEMQILKVKISYEL